MYIFKSKMKTVKYLILLLIIIVGLTACTQVDKEKDEGKGSPNLTAYFPLHQGMKYSYAGLGNEFASFERKILYVADNYLQLTDNNGGTVVVSVYKVNHKEIKEIFSKGEFYGDDNLIPDVRVNEEEGEIILQSPLDEGNSWSSNDGKRRIVAVDQKVKVPAGTFYQVVKVKVTYQDSDTIGYEYFAPNIGLIKREHLGENFEIKSELDSFEF